MPVSQTTKHSSETIGAGVSGFGLSYAITSVLSALLVVLKESNEAFHDVLTVITGHHWVTHGLLDVVVFLMLGFVFYRKCDGSRFTMNALIMIVVGATVISGLIITGYFI